MNITLSRIKEVYPYFNERPITEKDFWKACKKERVMVHQMPLDVNGYYEIKRGRHYILINSRLHGVRWLHTALHEFCHYLFDAPCDTGSTALFSRRGPQEDSREMLADAFALAGLLPFPDLVELARGRIDDPWLLNIAGARVLVRTKYGW